MRSLKTKLFGDNHFIRIGESGAAYLLPIRLTIIYLIVSVIVYAFGPFEWVTYKPALFYCLIFSYMAALWFGYRVGLMREFSKPIVWTEKHTDVLIRIVCPLIVLNFAVYIINIFRDYGFDNLNFVELAKQMAIGLKNPGLGYSLRYQRIQVLQGSDVIGGYAFSLFNYIWSFFKLPIVIIGMIYFKKLRPYAKVFTVLYLLVTVIFYMSIGTNIDILHVFLLLEIAPILKTFTRWREKKLEKKDVVKLICSLLAGLIFIACYFTWMMVSRGGINNYDQPDYNVGGVHVDSDISSQTETPSILMKFWVSFSSYFTQGYYGMSQALTLPWTPMFGLGNSMFAVDFITEHLYDIEQFTYQFKLEALGWKSGLQWHSIYTWLANDVSFYGVTVVMFLIGVLFGEMFKDAIKGKNPFAKISVFYFMLMLLFIPCNNQIAQRADTLFSFILILLCWFLCKHPPAFLRKIFNGVNE